MLQSRISSLSVIALIRRQKTPLVFLSGCVLCVCVRVGYVFLSRMLAVTMALTRMQWKTAVVSVWATAKAVKWSISHSMKKKAWVSFILRGRELSQT